MTTWLNVCLVAAGGACGSVLRYLITLACSAVPGGSSMLGTTLVNVLGCAAIGALTQYLASIQVGIGIQFGIGEGFASERARMAIQVGFLGGLTTFSTFAAESVGLAQSGRLPASGLYVAANLLLGWTALLLAAGTVKGWMA